MTPLAGQSVLLASLVVAIATSACALIAGGTRSPRWAARAQTGLLLEFLLLTGAILVLGRALVSGDMRLAYVADHTERALPVAYRAAALWAGQEGSLLLWAWMLSLVAAIAAPGLRRGRSDAVSIVVLGVVQMFFAALLLFAADPFAPVSGPAPADGRGLHPMLQHWAMVIHPPTLFLGYTFAVVPFALAVGALATGEGIEHWAARMRRWVLATWIFLSAGIALGAWWAYAELGWGGYWAWDPVENASLLPWLTVTALVHTLVIDRQRGVFRAWTASLACLTFVLCLVATYLTRSGIVQSVHAFAESPVSVFFLAFLGLAGLVSAALIVWRWPLIRSGVEIESLISREGFFLLANILLLSMAGAVLVGTLWPVLSAVVREHPSSVGPAYYNRIVAPLGLATAALMALGPAVRYGAQSARSLRRTLGIPAAITIGVLVTAAIAGFGGLAALTALGIALMAVLLIGAAFVRSTRALARAQGIGPFAAAARLIDNDHRRFGGQFAHLGVVLVILGIAGSNLYGLRETLSLHEGTSQRVGRYDVRFDTLRERRGTNFSAVEATLTVTVEGAGAFCLRPEQRFYDTTIESAAEVAIRTGPREDLYVALVGWEDGGSVAAFQVFVNPLTMWIWIGAGTMVLAGAFCLLPRLAPARVRVATDRRTEHQTARAPLPAAVH